MRFLDSSVISTLNLKGPGSATIGLNSFTVNPASTPLTGSSSYLFTYLEAPTTTVSTFTGTATTFYIKGPPTITTGGTGYAVQVESGVCRILDTTASSSTTTGAFRVVGGVGIGGNLYVGGTINGTFSGSINTTSVSVTTDGTASAPSYTFTNQSNTGMYLNSASILGFTVAGTNTLLLDATTTDITTITMGRPTATSGAGNLGHGSYLRFAGTAGDLTTSSALIAERIYTDATEQSELVLWKGNDISTANRDRIRLRSNRVVIECYSAIETVTIPTIPTGNSVCVFGSAVPSLDFTPVSASAALLTAGSAYRFNTTTVTDNTTASAGTNSTLVSIFGITASTIAATNTTVTTTNATTFYISGPPIAGTNQTITNAYALYSNSGLNFFGGTIQVNGGLTASGSTSINFSGNSGTMSTTSGVFTLSGPFSRSVQSINTNTTLSATTGGSFVVVSASARITLPSISVSPSNGLQYIILNTSSSIVYVIVGVPANENFDGNPSIVELVVNQYEKLNIIAHGSIWYLL